MSKESRYFRFCGYSENLSQMARQWSNINAAGGLALVAAARDIDRVIGHAMFVITGKARAEVAFEVADDFRGLGIGTILLHELALHAASVGITTSEATVLAANHRMIEVFRDSGFGVTTSLDHGSEMFELAIGSLGKRSRPHPV